MNDLQTTKNETELMTVAEVAEYLKLAERTVLNMIHRKEIPAMKIASQWRFVKSVIDDWILSKIRPVNKVKIESTKDYIPIGRLLKKEFIIMDLKPGKKEDILNNLISPLVEIGYIQNKEYYISQMMQRENIISTGIGNGMAIPHIRNISENPPGINAIVAGVCKEGTDFESLDKTKTHLFFLVCSDNEIIHVRIIARLSLIFNDSKNINRFLKAKSKNEFLNLFIKVNHQLNFQK